MIALISNKIAEKFKNATGIKTLGLKPYGKLDKPVNSHADMLICLIDKTIFCYSDYYDQNIDLFSHIKGHTIIKSTHQCKANYPYDIGLNVLVIGNRIFCKRNYVASEILEYANNNKYKIVDVKQGYSCCSTLVVDENSAITSDKRMYDVLTKEGIDTLLISTNDIKLEGYNCGFVGGCGCFLGKTAYFFGSVEKLREKNEIEQWLKNKNCEIASIFQGDVSDFGGVKFVFN